MNESTVDPTIRTQAPLSITVGSAAVCDVQIKEPSISAQHIKVTLLRRGLFQIKDLQSELGTYVQGKKIQVARVSIYDTIQLGHHAIELTYIAPYLSIKKRSKIRHKGGSNTTILKNKVLSVGSGAENDVQLRHPHVAQHHFDIQLGGETFLIRDNKSRFGTYVNGNQIGSSWSLLGHMDTLSLGAYKIPSKCFVEWQHLLDDNKILFEEQDFKINPKTTGTFYIGRDPDCQIHLKSDAVSWRHAKIVVTDEQVTLYDLASSNGCFVNGKRIKQEVITPMSKVSIGGVVIQLFVESQTEQNIRLDAIGLYQTLPTGKTLLNDISLSIEPGELVALMGPSGAGKTTLLEILTSQRTPSQGQVLLNGIDLHQNTHLLRNRIGYVPQEDILHRDLTVFQVLKYAAELKLPPSVTEKQIQARVETLLTQLGLAHIRDTIIGGEKSRGISGGQRKKVNIALELITEPKIIFLDEPTSGLDATSTLDVMRLLRKLADNGTTIVMTIHQPRVEAYTLLSNLILLTKGGHLAYYGPASTTDYFEKITQTTLGDNVNPADFIIDLLESVSINMSPQAWGKKYKESNIFTLFVLDRHKTIPQNTTLEPLPSSSFVKQYKTLAHRYMLRKLNEVGALIIQLIQAPIIAGSLALLFFAEGSELQTMEISPALEKIPPLLQAHQLQNGAHATIFLATAAALWFGCSNVAREIVSERAIYLREKRNRLSVMAYLFSILSYQSILVFFQTLVMSLVLWFTLGLSSNLFLGWMALWLTAVTGVSLGLLVSSVSKSEVMAISFVPLILFPQLLFGGYVKLYGLIQDSTLQTLISDIMPIRWGFEGLLQLEYHTLTTVNPQLRSLNEIIGFPSGSLLQSLFPWLVLLVYNIVFLTITGILLRRTKS